MKNDGDFSGNGLLVVWLIRELPSPSIINSLVKKPLSQAAFEILSKQDCLTAVRLIHPTQFHDDDRFSFVGKAIRPIDLDEN